MKIYTKTGDEGQTALFDGTRVSKTHLRIVAYGEVDELNSVLGCAVSQCADKDLRHKLQEIQRDLFAAGARLANPSDKRQKDKSDFGPEKASLLEGWIDTFATELAAMRNFILPGGHPAAGLLHLARCTCRRAERAALTLKERGEVVSSDILIYLNRLSDVLFVMARIANKRAGIEDIPW